MTGPNEHKLPPPTSRLAVANLFVALLALPGIAACAWALRRPHEEYIEITALHLFLPPAVAICSVVLGCIALVRITRSRGGLLGRRLAFAGVALGALSFFLAFLVPGVIKASESSQSVNSRIQLKQIVSALLQYQSNCDGILPPDLQVLYDSGGVEGPHVFKYPPLTPFQPSRSINPRRINEESDYYYARADISGTDATYFPLIYEKRRNRHNDGFSVGWADGHVSYCVEDRFVSCINRYADRYDSPPQLPAGRF